MQSKGGCVRLTGGLGSPFRRSSTNSSSVQLFLRDRAAAFLLSAFRRLYPAEAVVAAGRSRDSLQGVAMRRNIENEGSTSWVADLLLMHAKNTNQRRAASYARVRAASIASEGPQHRASPAILLPVVADAREKCIRRRNI